MNALFITGLMTGMVGSLHCATMCGPLAIAVYSKSSYSRQVAYNVGRLTTYVILGVVFGMVGQGLAIFGSQQVLSVIMGVTIIILTLYPRFQHKLLQSAWHTKVIIPMRRLLSGLIDGQKLSSVFLIGVLNGLLPCGLVYMGLSLSVASGSVAGSVLVMTGFGLGTSPVMLGLAGVIQFFKSKQAFSYQHVITSLAIIMGTLLILRGMALDIPYVSPVMTAVGWDLGITTCGAP
ncbi:sulfite exporter TauE/SafE family protein [Fulvivirga sp. 29W222]|uniref:Sulfite exporter TauE/SafE family protein n=1 Tax=Fulvivirga marina TaxID=2494733 RepID=A0A937G334_9BACT|nr:sulfite exporter TauE/SafE family protein [Fulvivirga marina]MBL6449361.1 sulfite exporter TauE/SafE family protein [Fulvivirga marina]